jgi:hypothetical protein
MMREKHLFSSKGWTKEDLKDNTFKLAKSWKRPPNLYIRTNRLKADIYFEY